MRVNWTQLRKRVELPALGVALVLLVFGAYFLGANHSETTGDAAASETPPGAGQAPEKKPHSPKDKDEDDKPAEIHVPSSASAAASSGMSGGTWMAGNPAVLGAEFRESVSKRFGNSSLGQAQLGMAGLGFECTIGAGGRMSCEKSLQAGRCTLTWSVSLQSGGDAGGDGFSRECR